ncbi:hypothetical protein F443_13064 [Phytophthora nicotianae P1569]|uniref:RxLR effector protein n=1 Tax=Phytophthora nicotianae P1569 TaxID=1317065 RepID=V9ES91_PHYNI|nr:hypothetical protein F443_13064 [Phytophthora nicotianae P1569]
MVNTKIHCTALVGAATLFLSGVNAHGYLGQPAVAFPNDVDKTQFIATIEASASGLSGSFSGSPTANTEAFWTAFKSSKFTSIKEFVTDLGQVVAIGANLSVASPILTKQHSLFRTRSNGLTRTLKGLLPPMKVRARPGVTTPKYSKTQTVPHTSPPPRQKCLTTRLDALVRTGGSGSNTPSESNTTTSGSTGQSSTPTVTTATPTTSTATPTATTSAPTASGSVGNEAEEDCDSLDVAGSDEEDGGSLDVAGSDGGEVGGDAETIEEDCGSLDVAGTKDEDCGSLDAAGSEAEEATTVSESSLNFDNVGGNYISGKVQPQKQN